MSGSIRAALYGLLAASFVVGMILLETSGLYSRLANATVRLEDRAQQARSRISAAISSPEADRGAASPGAEDGGAGQSDRRDGARFQQSARRADPQSRNTAKRWSIPGSEAAELVELSLEATLHGAELTRHLLAFARRQPLQPQRVELNGLIGELTRFLGRALRRADLDLARTGARSVAGHRRPVAGRIRADQPRQQRPRRDAERREAADRRPATGSSTPTTPRSTRNWRPATTR